MQAELTLIGHDTHTILIDLIDNPGVEAWANTCRKIDPHRRATFQPVPYDGRPSVGDNPTWQNLLDIYHGLKDTEFAIPLLADSPDAVTRQHLNIWHRCFTEGGKIIEDRKQWNHIPEVYRWLLGLNEWVHAWEDRFYEWPKTHIEHLSGEELNLIPDLVKQDIHNTGHYCDMRPYGQYHSCQHADLILDQLILGKTLMQSFLDNDDPRHWDTWGHTNTFGGCKLVFGDYRERIYRSDIFAEWLDRYALDINECRADFPLGNVHAQYKDAFAAVYFDKITTGRIQILD